MGCCVRTPPSDDREKKGEKQNPAEKENNENKKTCIYQKKAVSLHAECVQRKDIQKNSAIWQI